MEYYDEAVAREAGRLVRIALDEDLSTVGDITSAAVVPEEMRACGAYIFKEDAVVCGVRVVEEVCRQVSTGIEVEIARFDGDQITSGEAAIRVSGPARALLAAERTSLNFFSHLSGVATLTKRYVDAARESQAQVFDTRKTTPGMRRLEKYAVRCGGGVNHRMGLYDQVLIKDNHLAVLCARCGKDGLAAELRRIREGLPQRVLVEVEAKEMREVEAALEAGADIIMLDNMTLEAMREAVTLVRSRGARRHITEASGGVTLETIAEIAATGVDRISVGALTHSARAVDISLEIE